jgi:hypothetical protein
VVRGKRETLKRQLAAIWSLAADVDARIEAVRSAEELDRYLDRELTAKSLEIGLSMPTCSRWRAASAVGRRSAV